MQEYLSQSLCSILSTDGRRLVPPYYPSGSVGLWTSCGAQNFSIGRHWTCSMEIDPCKTFQKCQLNATLCHQHYS